MILHCAGLANSTTRRLIGVQLMIGRVAPKFRDGRQAILTATSSASNIFVYFPLTEQGIVLRCSTQFSFQSAEPNLPHCFQNLSLSKNFDEQTVSFQFFFNISDFKSSLVGCFYHPKHKKSLRYFKNVRIHPFIYPLAVVSRFQSASLIWVRATNFDTDIIVNSCRVYSGFEVMNLDLYTNCEIYLKKRKNV